MQIGSDNDTYAMSIYVFLTLFLTFLVISSHRFLNSAKRKKIINKEGKNIAYDIWHGIPRDLWHNIILRVSLADYVRMSAVSKSWRLLSKENSAASRSQVPWLMLPHHDKQSKSLKFFDLCESRVYKFNLPKNLRGGWCCGSSKGWLVMLKGPSLISFNNLCAVQIFLFNPISGIQLKLPQLFYLPKFRSKVELSSRDADAPNCIVAAAIGHTVLALCRPGDKAWTTLLEYKYTDGVLIRDILFSNGELHTLISYKYGKMLDFQTRTVKLGDGGPDVIVNLIPIETPQIQFIYPEGVDWVAIKGMFSSYLVESDGELLIVCKIGNVLETLFIEADGEEEVLEDDAVDVDEDNYLTLAYNKTIGFQVYKIGDPISGMRLTRISSLNDQILFVTAASTSLSIPASIFNGLKKKKNCIYFTHDFDYLMPNDFAFLSREAGIFYLEDERIVRCFPSMHNSSHCRMSWFSPNI